MPEHRSVLKRDQQNKRKNRRNSQRKSLIKTTAKKVLHAIEKGEKEKAGELLRIAVSVIHQAASKGVIHKNTASRKISRLSKKVSRLL
ncbi:MAG: 30S ribosomal protein S20 [Nitrospinae bacterium]|nr:30S ribosomal protein S20 [Nitrospinota bacterium]